MPNPRFSGWAQSKQFSRETKELSRNERSVDFDIWYIEIGVLLDLKIIYLTLFNVFKGRKRHRKD
jgi:lipopolysaccharide/colanic/teichoic acid biosynthesis glycosyltransferase